MVSPREPSFVLAVFLATLLCGCPAHLTPHDDADATADDDYDPARDDDDSAALDCDAIPAGPFTFETIVGPVATEDFAFDDEGYMIGAQNGSLFRSLKTGESDIWVPGSWADITGLRTLPGGDVVFANTSAGNLERVDRATLARTVVLSGLSGPDGIEVDLDGMVYLAEQAGGRIRRIDPDTGDFTIVAEGLTAPNGLSFDPTYTRLYVDSYGGNVVYMIDFDAHGTPGEVQTFTGQVGTGLHDGMGVDACGNVYICDYGGTRVIRVDPDDQSQELVVDLSGTSTWIPNMQWGSGYGDWDPLSLYVIDIADYLTYEVPVGVPEKERMYP